MPRANRCIVPGEIYHLTHRCHNQSFYFGVDRDRTDYCGRMMSSVADNGVSLLDFCVTCNHTHLLAVSDKTEAISRMVQQLDGQFAAYFNRRRQLSGSFWGDRFHCTMVDDGAYLWNCLRYIDLNMVRAGAVSHPGEWCWGGYRELLGLESWFPLLDIDRLLQLLEVKDLAEFRNVHEARIGLAIEERRLQREPQWTSAVAVGSESYVKAMTDRMGRRKKFNLVSAPDGAWYVR